MHQQYPQSFLTRDQQFNALFPLSVVAILAIIQMLTTFSIIGLEIGHIILSVKLTNLFAGFWLSLSFTILWISMFAAVCCCRRRSCATHAVVQNIIAFMCACALIGINIAFIQQPDKCFLPGGICDNVSWYHNLWDSNACDSNNISSYDCRNTRIALIKGQLAAGAVMAATCLIYLVLYFYVSSKAKRHGAPTAADSVMAPVYQQQSYMIAQPFQPSAPVMPSAFHQPLPQYNNMNYIQPNQHPAIYPQIPNDRF
ncbi:unnamed protein product [Adineta steineri]|uniref:Uncharacterized protein n=1 Tax=Adineta steineri TaxID=433720 RepID=A0A814GSV5_9BILA|nr:unnamed protein product [Adineta steineri]CAF1327930.1 unnamed protein product [Adineta steineri]CAF1450686.1 unnamed protein product [Adineta steineri]